MKSLFRSSALRKVGVVMSGTAAAQLITFAFSPLLSRLYDPLAFGVFGTYLSLAGLVGAAATLNFADAVVIPRQDRQAVALVLVSMVSTVIITLATGALCAMTSMLWPTLFGPQQSIILPWLLPLSVLFVGISQSLTAWHIRRRAYRFTAQSGIVRSLTGGLTQTGAGLLGLASLGLIGGVIAADIAVVVFLGLALGCRSRVAHVTVPSLSRLWHTAVDYRDFAVFGCPQGVMVALSQGLPLLLLAHYYGIAVAGSYAFGIRLLQAPMALVLTSVRPVLYPALTQLGAHDGTLYDAVWKSTCVLLGLSAIPACVGIVTAPSLFALIFGEHWRQAGEYGRWLILWLVPMMCNLPSSLAARILRLQRSLLLVDLLLLAGRAAILVVGGTLWPPVITVIGLSLVGAIFNVGFIVLVLSRLRRLATERGLSCVQIDGSQIV